MPAGVLLTVPAPVPGLETVSAKVGVNVAVTAVAAVSVTAQVPVPGAVLETARANVGVNVAVTAVAPVRVTVQGAVPEQAPPLQPVKTEVGLGVAVSVTTVPLV